MYLSFAFLSLLFFSGALSEFNIEEDDDEEDQIDFAMNYLRRYQYISPARSGNHDETTAIKNFQKFFHLNVTGELDEETMREMKKPRCGNPDIIIDQDRGKRFATQGKWGTTSLTFYQEYGDDMSHDKQRLIMEAAFKHWSDAAPRLTFTRVNDPLQANIRISFGRRTHSGVTGEGQCQSPFDGPGKVLAHAYFPQDGRIHFDDDEYFTELGDTSGWWWWRKESRSFLEVAVHEIGHALGLRHSNVQGAIMWPTARGGRPALHQDDINGVRYLYG